MKLKHLITIIICILCICTINVNKVEAKLSIQQLKEKFPQDKYWNHPNNPGCSKDTNNQDGYTDIPCPRHNDYCGTSRQTCNGFQVGDKGQVSFQCMGFAEKLGYDYTGLNPHENEGGWTQVWSRDALNHLKTGDIIRYKGHSVFVVDVIDGMVYYADCNFDHHCIIKWDHVNPPSYFRNGFSYVKVAPEKPEPPKVQNTNYTQDSKGVIIDAKSQYDSDITYRFFKYDEKSNEWKPLTDFQQDSTYKTSLPVGKHKIKVELHDTFEQSSEHIYDINVEEIVEIEDEKNDYRLFIIVLSSFILYGVATYLQKNY